MAPDTDLLDGICRCGILIDRDEPGMPGSRVCGRVCAGGSAYHDVPDEVGFDRVSPLRVKAIGSVRQGSLSRLFFSCSGFLIGGWFGARF